MRTDRRRTTTSLRLSAASTGLLLTTTVVGGVAPAGAAVSSPPVPSFDRTSLQTLYSPAPAFGIGAYADVLDLDGDGDQDVVTAFPGIGIVFELGRGDGTLAAPTRVSYGGMPYSLATGDLDEDGYPEVIARSRVTNDVVVFPGTASGPGAPRLVPLTGGFAGTYGGAMAADLDRDGHLDLMVPNNSVAFAVLKGDGDGGFVQSPVSVPLTGTTYPMEAPDLNGDGYGDVVSASTSRRITVSLSTGAGGFAFSPPTTYNTSTSVLSFEVVDLDTDGDLDLVWGVNGTEGSLAQGVFVLRGLGGGGFEAAPEKLFSGTYGGAAVVDVNGDGRLDISSQDHMTARVHNYLGTAAGGFVQAVQTVQGGGMVSQVLAADFDGDGRPDLHLAASREAASHVLTYRANLDSTEVTSDPVDTEVATGSPATFTAAASGYPVPTVQWQRLTFAGGTWTNLAGATATSYTTPAVTVGTVGYRYRAVFTNSTGTATTGSAGLSFLVAPTVSTQPADASTVAGQPASFTAAAGGSASTVRWQSSTDGTDFADVPDATSPTLTVTPAAAADGTLYRAVFTNDAGTATTRAAVLRVAPLMPLVTVDPADQEVGSGGVATFTAAASGDPAPSVRWQRSTDGAPFADVVDQTSPTLVLDTTYAQDGDRVRAVFSNAAGSVATAEAVLTVLATAPAVTLEPSDAAVDPGEDVRLAAAATGDPVPTVQWQRSADGGTTFTDLVGETGTELVVPALDRSDDGSAFRAVFSSPGGSTTTRTATVTVNPVAPVVTQDPQDSAVEVGQVATFEAGASGDPAPTVQWQVSTDGGLAFADLEGEVATSLAVTTTDGDDANLYRAVFANRGGTTATAAAVLTVSPVPVVLPSAPRDVVVTQTGSGQVLVTWAAPLDEGTSPVTGYVVGYAEQEQQVPADTLSAAFDDVAAGGHTAVVTAVSAAGAGPVAAVSFTVEPVVPPVVPAPPVIPAPPGLPVPPTTLPVPPAAAPTTVVRGSVVRPSTRPAAARDGLARTGADVGDALGLGSCGVLLGGLMLLVARRRGATGPASRGALGR